MGKGQYQRSRVARRLVCVSVAAALVGTLTIASASAQVVAGDAIDDGLIEDPVLPSEVDPLSSPPSPEEAAPNDGFGDLGFAPPTAAVPDGLAAERRPVGEPVRELIELREANVDVWEMSDGSRQVRSSVQPRYFQMPGEREWLPIDTRLVPDATRPGWFRSSANEWTVRFGPLSADSVTGVELTPATGEPLTFSPRIDPTAETERLPGTTADSPVANRGRAIEPQLDDDGSSVIYPNAWAGVDLIYRVTSMGVKEELVVHHASASTAFEFDVRGPQLAPATREDVVDSPDARIEQDPTGLVADPASPGEEPLTLSGLDIVDASGRPMGPESRGDLAYTAARRGAPANLEVRVDESWLASLPAEAFPITIDPTVQFNQLYVTSFGQYGNGSGSTACGSAPLASCQGPGHFRVGNADWPTGDYFYRASIQFDYGAAFDNGGQFTDATLQLWGAGAGSTQFTDLHAWSTPFGDVTFDTIPGTYIATTSGDNDDLYSLNVTSAVQAQVAGGSGSVLIGLTGEETTNYTYKSYLNAVLYVTVDDPPSPPSLTGFADGATSLYAWPTLGATGGTDPEGQPLRYLFRVASRPDQTGWMADSGLLPLGVSSWSVPYSVLRDGTTYWWTAYTWDGRNWSQAATWRRLVIDQRLGSGGPSPTESFGPATVNLANGNLSLAVGTPGVTTVAGTMGLGLAYNSHTQPVRGLRGTYQMDGNGNGEIDATDPTHLTRTDTLLNFNWAAGPPVAGAEADHFFARWDGWIRVPTTGSWELGLAADDGVRVWVGGTQVLDRWSYAAGITASSSRSFTAGEPKSIRVDYRDITGAAAISFYARPTGTSTWQAVPSSWLSTDPEVLADGWTVTGGGVGAAFNRVRYNENSVTLVGSGGETWEYTQVISGTSVSFVPPAGVDDVMSLTWDPQLGSMIVVSGEDGYVYEFSVFLGGRLERVRSTPDVRNPASTVYEYLPNGRLSRLRDPVSGRAIDLIYAPNGSCFGPAPAGALCGIQYPDGTLGGMQYDTSGRLTRIANPGDLQVGWDIFDVGYGPSGLIDRLRDPLANDMVANGLRADDDTTRWLIGYDFAGRASDITAPAPTAGAPRPARTMSYPNLSQTEVQVTGAGTAVERRVTFDAAGRTIQNTDSAGLSTYTEWDPAADRVLATTDTAGLKSTTIYTPEGWASETWGPAPPAWFNASRVPAGHENEVAHTTTAYDQGMVGLAASWWDNATLTGAPKGHWTGFAERTDGVVDFNSTGVPLQSGLVAGDANDFSGRLSGTIIFPGAGQWRVRALRDGFIRIYIDDLLVFDAWNEGTTNDTVLGPIAVAGAGEKHRIRIDMADTAGTFRVTLQWNNNGSAYGTVPGTSLAPRYGLPTTSDRWTSATLYTRTVTEYNSAADPNDGPHLKLPTRTIVDPAGLNLATTIDRELFAASGSYLRRTATRPPSGTAGQSTYAYWGATATFDNPCTVATDAANQGGMMRYETGPDPDGAGAIWALQHEFVYDARGRVVAHRVRGNDNVTSGWECTAYDARGRTTQQTDRNGVAQTMSYATPGVVTTAYADSAGAARTRRVDSDMLGREVSHVDELGAAFSQTYDSAGRAFEYSRKLAGEPVPRLMVRNAYNAVNGRLATIDDYAVTPVATTSIGYDAYGRANSTALPNGVTSTTGFSTTTGAAISLTHVRAGTTLVANYAAQDRSLRTSSDSVFDGVAGRVLGRTYTFDRASRLTRTVDSGNVSTATRDYAYDVNTNRCANATTCTTPTYTYDSADRIKTSPDHSAFTYDRWGNVTQATPRVTTPGVERIGDTSYAFSVGQPTQTWPVLVGSSGTFSATIAWTGGGTLTPTLRNSSGQAVTLNTSGTNPKTVTASVAVGSYTFELATTGSGTVTLSSTTWPAAAPRLLIGYDANNHATGIDDGTYNTVETLNPSGSVLRRQVWHVPTSILVEDTTFGDGYSIRAGQVTTNGPSGAVHTPAASTWPIVTLHGDIAATVTRAGAYATVPLTDEFGKPFGVDTRDPRDPHNRLGWVGGGQVYTSSVRTGVVRMGVRAFLPGLGRFLQPDPVEGGSCSAYDYVCADPINKFDFTGKLSVDAMEHWSMAGYAIVRSKSGVYDARRVTAKDTTDHNEGWTILGVGSDLVESAAGGARTAMRRAVDTAMTRAFSPRSAVWETICDEPGPENDVINQLSTTAGAIGPFVGAVAGGIAGAILGPGGAVAGASGGMTIGLGVGTRTGAYVQVGAVIARIACSL